MKILKLLNRTYLSILIIFSFLIVNSFSENEPVDIWNIDKEQIQENSENKELISTENMVKKIKLLTYKVPNNFEDYDPKYPDIIKIIMNDGSILIEKISHIKGGKKNPLRDEDINNKFLMCGGKKNILNKIRNQKYKKKNLKEIIF